MIEVSLVPTQFVDSCWKDVEEFLNKAAKYTHGRYEVDDIYDSLKEYDHQLWVAIDTGKIVGAVVTNVVHYPKRKYLVMSFCGGNNLKDWKDPMLKLLQRFAKDIGCDGIEATARQGWAKVFQNDGYKQHWVTFELPI